MKILSIHGKNTPIARRKVEELSIHGVKVIDHSPTLLSAFAAMRIASIIDKEDIDVIEASNTKDAMAALSATQLARKKNVMVIMNIPPNSQPPKTIPGEIRRKVDAWIFPSHRLLNAYPHDIRNAVVIPTTSFAYPCDIPPAANAKPVVSWIGDITRPDKLKLYLEEAEATEGDLSVRISGAGDAAKVMPVVRLSRHLDRMKDIIWVGEKYDTEAEIANSDALFTTNDDITEIEAAALLSGRPLLQPGELPAFLSGTKISTPPPISPEEYIRHYIDTITGLY